jgi:DNA-binding MarR family transcriptional regulator
MVTDEQIERFIQLSQALGARLSRPDASEWPDIELTMSQLRALILLINCPRRMSEIAASLGSSLSSATSMVERLESKGLVERRHDPDDRRVVMCHLTPLGRADIEQFWRLRQSRMRSVAHLLTPDEIERVIAALQVVADAISRDDGRPPEPETLASPVKANQ